MESERPKRILRDLALIYIALAHGTDENLDDAEMSIIARRLQDVQAGVSQGTVLRAVKDALDDYMHQDTSQCLEQAVERIRTSVPQSLRRRIVHDLTEIGKADDKFLFAEAQFIGDLVEAWKVNLTDLVSASAATWNVLGVGPEEGLAWTPIHDLVLIFVTLAHQTDQSLSQEEIEAITKKIGEWLPNADDDMVRRILHDTMRVYQEEGARTFDEAVAAVQASVPAYQRLAILDDLRYIADADGVLLVEERVMIEKIAEAWGCDTSAWECDPAEGVTPTPESEAAADSGD